MLSQVMGGVMLEKLRGRMMKPHYCVIVDHQVFIKFAHASGQRHFGTAFSRKAYIAGANRAYDEKSTVGINRHYTRLDTRCKGKRLRLFLKNGIDRRYLLSVSIWRYSLKSREYRKFAVAMIFISLLSVDLRIGTDFAVASVRRVGIRSLPASPYRFLALTQSGGG